MIVFLDFDGVTHGIDNNISGMSNLFNDACIDALNDALLPYHNCQIVITSTWRLEYSLEELKQKLGVLGYKVIDATPDIPPKKMFNMKDTREVECRAWLEEYEINEPVIAIDDKAMMYDTLPVYETQSSVGFCADDINPFQKQVQELL